MIKQNNEVILKHQSKEQLNIDGEYFVVDLTNIIKPVIDQLQGNVTIQISVKQKMTRKSSEIAAADMCDNLNRTPENDALLIIFSEDQGNRFLQKVHDQFLQKNVSEQISGSKPAIQDKRKIRRF